MENKSKKSVIKILKWHKKNTPIAQYFPSSNFKCVDSREGFSQWAKSSYRNTWNIQTGAFRAGTKHKVWEFYSVGRLCFLFIWTLLRRDVLPSGQERQGGRWVVVVGVTRRGAPGLGRWWRWAGRWWPSGRQAPVRSWSGCRNHRSKEKNI